MALNEIKFNLKPTYTQEEIANLQSQTGVDLEGKPFKTGFIGLNNLKKSDYMSVVLQVLVRVRKVRDFFLWRENWESNESALIKAMGEFVCKVWNPRRFKASISPDQVAIEIAALSKQRYNISERVDVYKFYVWLLNQLHLGLGGHPRKKDTVIYQSFMGKLRVTDSSTGVSTLTNFLILSMDMPLAELFVTKEDGDERDQVLEQIPLFELLTKFDGSTVNADGKTFELLQLPEYLVFHLSRFSKNSFFTEKVRCKNTLTLTPSLPFHNRTTPLLPSPSKNSPWPRS